MQFGLGVPELLIIVVILLILFGPKRLPELARAIGRARREYELAASGKVGEEEESEKTSETKSSEEKDKEKLLIETAKKLGIKTEGKTLEEIAEEIVKVTEGKK